MPDTTPPCPVCDSADTHAFADRQDVAVHQNLLLDSAAQARGIGRGRLQMRCCAACGFVFNASFDDALMRYGAQYDNAQHFSPSFLDYIEDLVRHLVEERGVTGKRVVEVGCGQGGFLRRLVEPPAWNNTGWGFDPAYVGPPQVLDGRLRFEQRLYDETAAEVAADVVVCRHVIEHVPSPVDLLRSVRRALANSPDASVYFETPCVAWILDNEVLWDLFYEHCSLFTTDSLSLAFRRAGFDVREARHVFGGQYLWLEATPSQAPDSAAPDGGTDMLRSAQAFGELEVRQRQRWIDRLGSLAASGGVALWGAGAKGVTFANLVDPDATRIACVVDVNPGKQGHFLPGTGHPIVAPEHLLSSGITAAVALNPNYVSEIRQTVDTLGAEVQVVDLMAPE